MQNNTDELYTYLDSNPHLKSLVSNYVKISNATTDTCNANAVEDQICNLSHELNKLAMSQWIDSQQQNIEMCLKQSGEIDKSGKKSYLALYTR